MSDSSNPQQTIEAVGDAAPLAWISGEIRTTTQAAIAALQEFLGAKSNFGPLREARTQVHLANGALQMIDLRGASLLLEVIEQLLRRWESEPGDCSPSAVRRVEAALEAVAAYLESLRAGRPDQPIRLFANYREILKLAGAARVHPADLMFPDLTRRPAFHAIAVLPLTADQLRVRRARFEGALLGFLRDAGDRRARREMRDALADMERLPQRSLSRTFWWVVRGLLDALDAGALASDVDLKRVLARVNLQLRRLIEGHGAVAERLLIDALYYIGRADPSIERVAEARRLFNLDTLLPADFERSTLKLLDPAQVGRLRETLTETKTAWGLLAAGSGDPAAFARQIAAARGAAASIEVPAIERLLDGVAALGRQLAAVPLSSRETVAIEAATALLLIDLGVDELPNVDERFDARAEAMLERLAAAGRGAPMPAVEAWITELARKAQDRLTMQTVVAELQGLLREVEQRLDRFFRDPAERADLAAVDRMIEQMASVLSLLGFDDVVAALADARDGVRAYAADTVAADAADFARLAGNLGAIGFFIETLNQDPERTRALFRWNEATGVLGAEIAVPRGRAAEDESEDEFGLHEATAENVETATREHLARARELSQLLAQTPTDIAAARQLEHVAGRLVNDADLLDDADLKRRASHWLHQVRKLIENPQPAPAAELAQSLAPAAVEPPPQASSAPLPQSKDAADQELLAIFVEEANEVLDSIDTQLPLLREARSDKSLLTTIRRAFHTLKGSSRMVGLAAFGDAAWSIEQCCNAWLAQERAATDDLLALAAAAGVAMRDWIRAIAVAPATAIDPQPLIAAANGVRDGRRFELALREAPQPASAEAPAIELPAVEAPPAEAATHEPPALAESAAVAEELRRIGPVAISHGLYSVFLSDADESIRALAQDIAEWRFEPHRPVSAVALRRAHSLAGICATVGLETVRELAAPLDDLLHEMSLLEHATAPQFSAAQFDALERVVERMRGMLHQFAAGIYPPPAEEEAAAARELLGQVRAHASLAAESAPVQAAAPEPAAPVSEEPAAAAAPEIAHPEVAAVLAAAMALPAQPVAPVEQPPAAPVHDEIDVDLLPVFLAEAGDLLPAVAERLRALAAKPKNRAPMRELMRQLHTLKGSARMTGAMRLGELLHDMETRVESAMQASPLPRTLLDDLHAQYDQATAMFEALQRGEAVAPAAPAAAAAQLSAEAAPAGEEAAAQTAAHVRVRSDVLDKLVDQAGEVLIARSRVENHTTTLKSSLLDLTENIHRLRTQMRELEIQAEAQIQARSEKLSRESGAFDPLEFDRFSRLQELTRMISESIEDVATIHGSMLKGLQTTEGDLSAQYRLTRELQQQLMRVRLVPFDSIAERVYRLARQSGKELDKRVGVDIRGGRTELDRAVLERMAAPFEHLVRNAIVHGIEAAAARRAAGKPEVGELRIEVRQEANEIILVFADDGAGLDLKKIRARGLASGLLRADQNPSDRELMELVFAPGFSTAAEVTGLAGRGVGLDVVRSELSGLGGRIAIASEAGRGTRFTLNLPLTLSVTQVVLVSAGGRRYAIPAGMVEQVKRVRPEDLAEAISEGVMSFAPGVEVTLRTMAQLLGEETTLHSGRPVPVVLLRSGDDRMAVVADEVGANQEVVVKSVGAQVSRLAGILGATILGDGEIVLIVNPVQLIVRAPEPPRLLASSTVPQPRVDAPATSEADVTLASAPVIMVVDDSLTVRRVTQRLLERSGYEVLLAKDGVDALRLLQDARPDVMLVDIEMPRMDGFDLTRNLRTAEATRAIPIVMITSRTADKHRRHALELGVNAYLGKPYQEDELLSLIKRFIAEKVTA